MPRPVALLALGLASVVAAVAGVASPAAAQQVPGLTATVTVVPTSTGPGGTAQATAVFQPPTTFGPVQVTIDLINVFPRGNATLALGTNTSELTGCVLRNLSTRVRCDWLTGQVGPQTLTVTINVAASAVPDVETVQALGAPSGGGNLVPLAFAAFAVTQAPPPTDATTVATTVATTAAPTGPTTPTSSAVAPTSAAATTQPGALPPTGGSDANAFIALTVLALGAFLVIMARKVRET
jgi:hypothetical protein